jgi:hypothetical protein
LYDQGAPSKTTILSRMQRSWGLRLKVKVATTWSRLGRHSIRELRIAKAF